MAILRPIFDAERLLTCAQTEARNGGALVRVAGVVLVRQRPGKGNAIFVTLEDETGIINVVLWARMFEQFRREVMAARLMAVEGVVEKSPEGVVHLVARKVIDRSSELARLSEDHDTTVQLARADVVANPRHPGTRRTVTRATFASCRDRGISIKRRLRWKKAAAEIAAGNQA